MPQAYVQYGWRRYRSGKCSYKGWEQSCPEHHQQHHGRHEYDENFWDYLFPGAFLAVNRTTRSAV
jgi:hypothetical protein